MTGETNGFKRPIHLLQDLKRRTCFVVAPPARPALFVDNSMCIQNIDIMTKNVSSNFRVREEEISRVSLQFFFIIK